MEVKLNNIDEKAQSPASVEIRSSVEENLQNFDLRAELHKINCLHHYESLLHGGYSDKVFRVAVFSSDCMCVHVLCLYDNLIFVNTFLILLRSILLYPYCWRLYSSFQLILVALTYPVFRVPFVT